MEEAERYKQSWKKLRFFQLGIYIFGFPTLFFLTKGLVSETAKVPAEVIFFGLPSIIFINLYLFFHCPRCGKRFFYRGFLRSISADKCMNCGLERGANLEDPGDCLN